MPKQSEPPLAFTLLHFLANCHRAPWKIHIDFVKAFPDAISGVILGCFRELIHISAWSHTGDFATLRLSSSERDNMSAVRKARGTSGTVLGHNLDSSDDEDTGFGAQAVNTNTGWAAINLPPPSQSVSTARSTRQEVVIIPPIIENSEDYRQIEGENVVQKVIGRVGKGRGEAVFKVRFEDGHVENVSFSKCT